MFTRPIIVALLSVGLAGCASARSPELELPDFDHLRGKATETVDFSLGSFTFFLARRFMDDSDADSVLIKDMLKGVSSMRVRHYEFADDFAYSLSDLDSVRSQLTDRGWNALARIRDRKNNEDVGIYIALQKEKITGFAIVASEPREFTIVNIVGALDPKQVAAFRERFASDGLRSLGELRSLQGTADAEADADADDVATHL